MRKLVRIKRKDFIALPLLFYPNLKTSPPLNARQLPQIYLYFLEKRQKRALQRTFIKTSICQTIIRYKKSPLLYSKIPKVSPCGSFLLSASFSNNTAIGQQLKDSSQTQNLSELPSILDDFVVEVLIPCILISTLREEKKNYLITLSKSADII